MSSFSERYAQMTTEELAHIAIRGDLVEEAQKCLEEELKKRGIYNLDEFRIIFDEQDSKMQRNVKSRILEDKKKADLKLRILLAFVFFSLCMAGWKWFVTGDKHNAIGISAAMAIVLPTYLIYHKLRSILVQKLMR